MSNELPQVELQIRKGSWSVTIDNELIVHFPHEGGGEVALRDFFAWWKHFGDEVGSRAAYSFLVAEQDKSAP